MKRLSLKIKKKLLSLIKQDKSLREISLLLGLSKTTIYYHMRKIRGKKFAPVVLDTSCSRTLGEFLGVFAGDGYYFYDKKRYYGRIRITFNKNEEEIAKYYSNVVTRIAKRPRLYYRDNVIIMDITCKELVSLIKEYLHWDEGKKVYTISLNPNKTKLSKLFFKGFVKGLIDSDGYVRKNRPEIYFGSTSKNLLKNMREGLDKFGVNYVVYEQTKNRKTPFFKLRVSGREVLKCCRSFKPMKSGPMV